MALSKKHLEELTRRGLDVERLAGLGWDSVIDRASIEWLMIPVIVRGEVVNRKYRRLPKVSDNDAINFYQEKGGEKALYNFDCLLDPTLAGEPLIITEGELDAESAKEAGFQRVVSVPDGAPSKVTDSATKFSYLLNSDEALIDELVDVKDIILAVDGDTAGGNLYDSLLPFLGAHRCKHIKYPWQSKERLKRWKDLNEVLIAFGTDGVRQTIETAQFHPIDGIFALSELPERDPRKGEDPRISGLEDYCLPRKGDFCVVTGIPSHGKTTFCLTLAFMLARYSKWRVVMALFETDIESDLRTQLMVLYCDKPGHMLTDANRRDAADWIDEHFRFLIPKSREDPTFDWFMQKAEAACRRFQADMVLLDPWNELEHDWDKHFSETRYVGAALKALKRFAKYFDVYMMVTAHPAKDFARRGKGDEVPMPTLYDVEGSRHWYGKCDMGIIVHRNFVQATTTVKIGKSRYHHLIGRPGEIEFTYSHVTKRYSRVGHSEDDEREIQGLVE